MATGGRMRIETGRWERVLTEREARDPCLPESHNGRLCLPVVFHAQPALPAAVATAHRPRWQAPGDGGRPLYGEA
jgi:hypothetical protein